MGYSGQFNDRGSPNNVLQAYGHHTTNYGPYGEIRPLSLNTCGLFIGTFFPAGKRDTQLAQGEILRIDYRRSALDMEFSDNIVIPFSYAAQYKAYL